MKKGDDSASTIIIGPSKSVLVYALHSLEDVLGLARFRVFMPKLLLLLFQVNYQQGQNETLLSAIGQLSSVDRSIEKDPKTTFVENLT